MQENAVSMIANSLNVINKERIQYHRHVDRSTNRTGKNGPWTRKWCAKILVSDQPCSSKLICMRCGQNAVVNESKCKTLVRNFHAQAESENVTISKLLKEKLEELFCPE